jgi:transcriptional regulator with XRE-family HTH domain
MTDEHVARLNSVLRSAIRLSEYSNRDIERKLGFSGGYLSRLFGGQIDIKMSHILNVLEIIGLYPSEFFQMAFPPQEGEPSPLMRKILDMTPQARPIQLAGAAPTPPPPALTPREIQDKIVDALRMVFEDLEKHRR